MILLNAVLIKNFCTLKQRKGIVITMDKKQLNDAFDTFNPTYEQKQKMFDNINKQAYGKKSFDFKKIYIPTAVVAAAAFTFAIGTGMFDTNSPINTQTHIVQNTPSDTSSAPKNENISQSCEVINDTNEVQSKDNINSKQQPQTVGKTQSGANTNNQSNIEKVLENTKPVEEKPIVPNETTNFAMLNINAEPDALVNTEPDAPTGRAISEPVVTSAMNYDENAQYELTYEDFCQKIGYDITEKIAVPEDMQNTTEDKKYFNDGEIENWDITYMGSENRSINVNTSLDFDANSEYFENPQLEKTDINGNEAVVICSDKYMAYMKTQNVNYSVTGTGITEQELGELLYSLSE